MYGGGKGVLGSKMMLDVKDRVACLVADLTTERIVAAMGRYHEAAAVKVDQYGGWFVQGISDGPVNMDLDGSVAISRFNVKYFIGIRGDGALGSNQGS